MSQLQNPAAFTFRDALEIVSAPAPSRDDQLLAAMRRIEAARREALPERSPQEIAADFRRRARTVLADIRRNRVENADIAHMTRATTARHQAAALALVATYRRCANEALAPVRVRNMLAASIEAAA